MPKKSKKPGKGRVNPTATDRTRPIASTLQKVAGYGTLTIYKMEASPFWYARYYEDRKIIRRSLKVADKREALKAAKKLFVDIKHHAMNKLPYTRTSGFEVCARGLLKENEARAARGELSVQKQRYDTARLEADLLPHFGKYELADVNYAVISDYINKLSTPERPLSINTLKIHLSHIKTILRYPPTKRHSSPVITMPEAVNVYERLLQRQKEDGFGKPADYLFQPEHAENRDYGLRILTRQFDQLLKLADLKTTPNGENRTLHSLRHTCIMFRLTQGGEAALLTIARSARTSPEMIDRFYAKHLTAEMNVEQLQSLKRERKKRQPKGQKTEPKPPKKPK